MTPTEQLFDAIRRGDAAQARRLLQRDASLAAARDPSGVSALLFACYNRRRELIDLLAGALPALDLFEAAAAGRGERVNTLLAADPSLAQAFSPDGFTALHYAAFFGQPQVAQALLAAGAAPNAQARNAMQVFPLHSAVAAGQRAIVALLLEHGADPNTRQQGGWTPLQGAAHLGDAEMVRLLLEHGADRAAINDEGKTALEAARADGHAHLFDLLRLDA
jgi:ankyrin repeat protein